jgi:hypothetical protein
MRRTFAGPISPRPRPSIGHRQSQLDGLGQLLGGRAPKRLTPIDLHSRNGLQKVGAYGH